jgi:hypothetical protein
MAKMDWPVAVIALANDAELESLADGTPQVYWTEGPLGEEASGARQVLLHAEVLSRVRCDAIRFVAQWSVDNRSWQDVPGYAIDGLAAASAGPDAGEALFFAYTGLPRNYAPHQRYGISVTGDPDASGIARLGRARLSATVSLVPGPVSTTQTLCTALAVTAGNTGSSDATGIAPFGRAVVIVDVSAFAASGSNPTLAVEVSGGDGESTAVWLQVASDSLTATGQYLLDLPLLVGNQLRVAVSCPAGAGVTFSARVMLRG